MSGLRAPSSRDVWVFIQRDEKPLPVSLELLTKGRELAEKSGGRLAAVLFGGDGDDINMVAPYGPDIIYHGEDWRLALSDEEVYTGMLARMVSEEDPAVLLFGATPFGRSFAPRLAARLGTGLTADCTALDIDPATGLLQQTRPAFGGNLMALIVCPDHRPQMATVRPGVFQAVPAVSAQSVEIVKLAFLDGLAPRVRRLSFDAIETGKSIASAELIVSVGRGIGHQKNLKLVEKLAQLLGARIGASRPLIEAGWLPYSCQIGQTGCNVAPKLLLAFGISGAIQHLAGISGAQCIVAVNSDPDAPVFGVSHYAVVGDCQEVLREMIAHY